MDSSKVIMRPEPLNSVEVRLSPKYVNYEYEEMARRDGCPLQRLLKSRSKTLKAAFILVIILSFLSVLIGLDLIASSNGVISLNRDFFMSSLDPKDSIKKVNRTVFVKSKEDLILLKEIRSVGNILDSKVAKELKNEKSPASSDPTCPMRRPRLEEIQFSNVYWQVMSMRQGPFMSRVYLYGAYLDIRRGNAPQVRILISAERHFDNPNGFELRKPRYCQFWYRNHSDPVVTNITAREYIWWEEWGRRGRLHPFLLSCPYPTESTSGSNGPESVSIVEIKCTVASNELKINYEIPQVKKDFGVCVKGLSFPSRDISSQLVEWIEMMGILGAQGIHFHLFAVHPNVSKVLNYYEKRGLITVKPFALPGFQPTFPNIRQYYFQDYTGKTWKQEVIPYNDCFLTNMYKYKYIAAIDIDEVILPVESSSWKEMVESLESDLKTEGKTSFCFRMKLFVDRILNTEGKTKAIAPNATNTTEVSGIEYFPEMVKRQHHVGRICNDMNDWGFKCFHNTAEVLLIHNHYPKSCLGGPKSTKCSKSDVQDSLGYVHHHSTRNQCQKQGKEKLPEMPFTYDPTILRFKDQLKRKVNRILNIISNYNFLNV